MLENIEKMAKANKIPIMDKEGINYLTKLIEENKCEKILEIGTAIGYSAIKMAKVSPKIRITTLERDERRAHQARVNIDMLQVEDQIEVIETDALEYKTNNKFDLIFIDAAKAQYIKFFEKFKKNLRKNGIIVSDNLKFHGLVNHDKSRLSKNLRSLVTKIENYIEFLKENEEFKTEFIDVGDGVAVSRRKNEE